MNREQLPRPRQQEWRQNAEDFARMGFPRAIGAMDGKHFWIKVNCVYKLCIIILATIKYWLWFLQLQRVLFYCFASRC